MRSQMVRISQAVLLSQISHPERYLPQVRRGGRRFPVRPGIVASRDVRRFRRLPRADAGRTRRRASAMSPTRPGSTSRGWRSSTPRTIRAPPAARAELARDGHVKALVKGSSQQRGAAGARRGAGIRTAHRTAALARLFPGHCRSAARVAAGRRAHERDAQSRRQARHRAKHGAARASRSASPRRTSRCSPRWTARARVSLDDRRRGAEGDGDARPVPGAMSTGR